MSTIFVCPLSSLGNTITASGAQNLISLAGPGKSIDRPAEITDRFLALEFNDINEPREGLITPNKSHLDQLVGFLEDWNGDGPLVIQCWMGVSRSTAAALIACAALNPDQDMVSLATTLRSLSPTATPNPLMISLADKHLGLQSRLVKAVQAIGRGADAFEGAPFELSLSR